MRSRETWEWKWDSVQVQVSKLVSVPSDVVIMGALAIVDRLLRGNFELGIKITLGFFPMRSWISIQYFIPKIVTKN